MSVPAEIREMLDHRDSPYIRAVRPTLLLLCGSAVYAALVLCCARDMLIHLTHCLTTSLSAGWLSVPSLCVQPP